MTKSSARNIACSRFLIVSAIVVLTTLLTGVVSDEGNEVLKRGNLRNLASPGFITMCRKYFKIPGTYITIEVKANNRQRIRELRRKGAVYGPCAAKCASLCDHEPCRDDFTIANTTINATIFDTCTCKDKSTVAKDKCVGLPNTQCGFNETCACVYGFWGTNVSVSGCPNEGFTVRDLPYDFDDLEPYIDTRTMILHHQKHHATYVANLNNALKGTPEILKPIRDIQAGAIAAGTAVRNNGGGHYNHALFWTIMAPPASANKTVPSAQLQALIDTSFTNTSNMVALFNALAAPGSVFGSGWAWICVNGNGTQLILKGTANQDNPLMTGLFNETLYPILGLDVWEHAYYLKYQNLRTEYVKSFWNLVNWDVVSANAKYVIENKMGVPV